MTLMMHDEGMMDQENHMGGYYMIGYIIAPVNNVFVPGGVTFSVDWQGEPHMPSHWETPPSSNSKCHGLEAWQWQLCQSIGLKNRVRWILEPVGQIVELEAKSIKILVEAHQMVHATDLRLKDKKKIAKQVRDLIIPATWASWSSQVEERLRLGSKSKKLSNLLRTILFGSEAWGPRSNSEVSKLLGGLRKALQKRYVFGKEPAVHPLVEDAIKRFLTMQEKALSQKASLIHKVANWNHGSHGWQQDARETKRKTLHALCDWAARAVLLLKPGLILSNQYDLVKEFCRDCMSQDSLGRVFNHIKISLAEYMRRLEALTYREDEDNTSSDEDLIETDSTEEGTGSQEEADDSSFEVEDPEPEEPPALVAKSKKRWADLVDDSDEEELPAWA